jgi:hypothetical protein
MASGAAGRSVASIPIAEQLGSTKWTRSTPAAYDFSLQSILYRRRTREREPAVEEA